MVSFGFPAQRFAWGRHADKGECILNTDPVKRCIRSFESIARPGIGSAKGPSITACGHLTPRGHHKSGCVAPDLGKTTKRLIEDPSAAPQETSDNKVGARSNTRKPCQSGQSESGSETQRCL